MKKLLIILISTSFIFASSIKEINNKASKLLKSDETLKAYNFLKDEYKKVTLITKHFFY